MFADIFVYFILEKGLISEKQASGVLAKRISKVRPAVKAAYINLITEDEAINIMQMQKDEDMPFEYLASRENLLTNEQLLSLLGRQTKEDMLVMQVLFDKGVMTMNDCMKAIELFKAEYNLTDAMYDDLVNNEAAAYAAYISGVPDDGSLFSIYAVTFINVFMRNVTPSFRVSKAYSTDKICGKYIFFVECIGDEAATVGVVVNDTESFLNYGSRFSRQRLREYDDDSIDIIKEFLNLVAGMFIADVEERLKLSIDIKAPKQALTTQIEYTGGIFAMDVFSDDGSFTAFLFSECDGRR